MTERPAPEELGAEVQAAISEVMQRHGMMLNNFVSVCEVINSEGEEALWLNANPGIAPWTTIGFLRYSLLLEESGESRG